LGNGHSAAFAGNPLHFHQLTSGHANFEGWMPLVLAATYLKGVQMPWSEVPPVPARLDLSSVQVPIPCCAQWIPPDPLIDIQ
jgi:hypothetical protein